MATKVFTQVTDDINDSAAAKTVRFSYDGMRYEIDLSEENCAKFDDAMIPWITHARRLGKDSPTHQTRHAPRKPEPVRANGAVPTLATPGPTTNGSGPVLGRGDRTVPISEFQAAVRQIGENTQALADHFDVPYHTAYSWLKTARNRSLI